MPYVTVPAEIVCVECGGTAHLLSHPPSEGHEPWGPGDIVAYRCADCLERFDMELADEDVDGDAGRGDRPSGDSW